MPLDLLPEAAARRSESTGESEILIPGIAADGSLYPIGKFAAHLQGALHLAVSVFVFSGERLLVQRRAAGKYHSAGMWANTCCTHPHWDETPASSAARRLGEELGLYLPLTHTAIIDYAARVASDMHERERVHVFRAEADTGRISLTLDPQEVCEVRWETVAQLRAEARSRPHAYAPWFRIYLERWDELGF